MQANDGRNVTTPEMPDLTYTLMNALERMDTRPGIRAKLYGVVEQMDLARSPMA